MTVHELIELLRGFDQDSIACIMGDDFETRAISVVEVGTGTFDGKPHVVID